jgi:hypothetical protein
MSVQMNAFRRAVENLPVRSNVEAFTILWEEMTDDERIEAVVNIAGELEELAAQLEKEG